MYSFEELREKLNEKIDKEYDNFINDLRKEKFDVVIERAYEIVSKQEIKDYLQYEKLDLNTTRALLGSDKILDDLYDEWLGADGKLFDSMEYVIDDRIHEIENDFFKKTKNKSREMR